MGMRDRGGGGTLGGGGLGMAGTGVLGMNRVLFLSPFIYPSILIRSGDS